MSAVARPGTRPILVPGSEETRRAAPRQGWNLSPSGPIPAGDASKRIVGGVSRVLSPLVPTSPVWLGGRWSNPDTEPC